MALTRPPDPAPGAGAETGDPLAYDPAADHPLVAALLADQLTPELGDRVDLAVDAGDRMLAYSTWLADDDRDQGLVAYFNSGLAAYRAFGRLLAWRFGELAAVPSLLDFASGHGRLTRFLLTELAPERVWVSDVKAGAVAFQRRRFGVPGAVAPRRPEELVSDHRFAAVLVASLFTHLPRSSFARWLGRLASLVEPGGMLVFSVHDEAVMLPGRTMPEDGFYFEQVSEDPSLDRSEYGSTWVSEEFVRRTLAEVAPGFVCHRLPRGLWHLQDLYLAVDASRGPVDFTTLIFDRPPEGCLEVCEQAGPTTLRASGWAVADGGGRTEVRLSVGGAPVAAAVARGPRADVAARLGLTDERVEWEVRWQSERALSPTAVLLFKAVDERGLETVLHLGTVAGARLSTRLARRRRELDETAAELRQRELDYGELATRLGAAEARIATLEHEKSELAGIVRGMRSSRFWKLRDAWFRVKKRLGLVDGTEPGPLDGSS